jgi:hypothetical protein
MKGREYISNNEEPVHSKAKNTKESFESRDFQPAFAA